MVSVEEGQSTEGVINGRGVRERGTKNRRGRDGKGRGRGESNALSAEVAVGQPLAEQLPRQRPLARRGGPSYFATRHGCMTKRKRLDEYVYESGESEG
ncbi:hypothetical protein AYX13_07043 [Cryptococcus neoformans]|nr:hypothetical protein AYX13_07043 [Cryptococcus neoformans var. grubii]